MKKERLLEFDILRGIAFIFIVIQHTIGGFSQRTDISFYDLLISKFIYTIGIVGVPIFVCLTAVSLLYTYYDDFSIKDFYVKKIKFLVIPYVIFSFLNIYFKNKNIQSDIILTLLAGNAEYHLWYMGMILRLYLYFPLILIFTRKLNRKSTFTKILFFIFYTLGYWLLLKNNDVTTTISKLLFKNPTDLQLKIVAITPLLWSIYFVIGAYLILNYKIFKQSILKYKHIIIIGYSLALLYYYYVQINHTIGDPIPYIKYNTLLYIFYCSISILFFYIISYYITSKCTYTFNILKIIGKYSFPAYMFHIIVLNQITWHIHVTNHLHTAITFLVLTVSITTALCYVLNYLPYSEYLIGTKSKFNNLVKKKIPTL